ETDKKSKIDADLASAEAALEHEKLQFVKQEKALQEQQQSFFNLQQQLRTKENEKNLAAQKLHYLNEKEQNLQAFLQKSGSQLQIINNAINNTGFLITEEEKQLQHLQQQVAEAKVSLQQTRNEYDLQRKAVDQIRNEQQAVIKQQFAAEKKVAVADTTLTNIQKSIHQLKDEFANRKLQLQQLENDLHEKEQFLAEEKDNLISLQEAHQQAQTLIADTHQQLEQEKNTLVQANRILDSKKNEYALLKSLVDSMEGYPESVKFLHKNNQWSVNAPLLSDIIYVNEAYRTAVENVLEPYLNYYVVANLSEAARAIQLLDENKKGKANFFLLENIKKEYQSFHQNQSIIGIPALSVIEADEQYLSLFKMLLGNVCIADEENMHNTVENDWIILNKAGKFVQRKHSIQGGSVGVFEGKKIGRAKNLEKLSEEISIQEGNITLIKASIHHLTQEIVKFQGRLQDKNIRQLEQQIHQLNNQIFATKNKIENTQAQQLSNQQKWEDLENALLDEQDAIAATRTALEELSLQLQNINQQWQNAEQAYQQAEKLYNQSAVSLNALTLDFTKQQSKLQAHQQELQFQQKQLKDLEWQIQQNKNQLEEVYLQIKEGNEQLTETNETVLQLLTEKEAAEITLAKADQQYYNQRSLLQQKENDIRQKAKSKEIIDVLLGDIKEKLNELKLQLSGMKERLKVEFKLDLETVLSEERQSDATLEALQNMNDKLRKRLENMGEINPTAIEAYTEMKKRYEFILEQKNDLRSAKESLLQTIQEVEATANQQFLETYQQVRENFQQVFKALFTEEDTA
ncbi:MAG: chromosome segregation protein SMC, partial [Chitinophagaceae bacterium]